MYTLPEPFELRPVGKADQEFLDELYFASREDLHQAVPDAALLRQLIAMQHATYQAGLQENFPDAEYWVLQQEGRPIGRAVVHRSPEDLRLLDLAVVPSARRAGAAKAVVRALQAAASSCKLPLTLAVGKANHPACNLYLGLGFTVQSADHVLVQMAWRNGEA